MFFAETVKCTTTGRDMLPYRESSVDAPVSPKQTMPSSPGSPLNRSSQPETYISVRRSSETNYEGPLTLTGIEVRTVKLIICFNHFTFSNGY